MDETDSLSSGSDGVKLAEMGVPGIPLAWTCSLSLPSVPSSSSELWVPSVTASAGSDSAGSDSPPDSLVSEQRLAGSRQCPVARGQERERGRHEVKQERKGNLKVYFEIDFLELFQKSPPLCSIYLARL